MVSSLDELIEIAHRDNPYHDELGRFTSGPGGTAADNERIVIRLGKPVEVALHGGDVPRNTEAMLHDMGALDMSAFMPGHSVRVGAGIAMLSKQTDTWLPKGLQGREVLKIDSLNTSDTSKPQDTLAVLRKVTEAADAHDVVLVLDAHPFSTQWVNKSEVNLRDLKRLYGRYGFVEPKERSPLWLGFDSMVRMPNAEGTKDVDLEAIALVVSAFRDNPYHDELGRFATGPGGGGGDGLPPAVRTPGPAAMKNVGEWLKGQGWGTPADLEANARAVFAAATPTERETGVRWYEEAHSVAREIADAHGLTIEQSAGVIAALSPNSSWETNQANARFITQMMDAPTHTITSAALEARYAAALSESHALSGAERTHAEEKAQEYYDAVKPWVGTHATREIPTEVLARVAHLQSYPDNVQKAIEIIKGANPRDVLWKFQEVGPARGPKVSVPTDSGLKVRSFYSNIMFPRSSTEVTVDTHIMRALSGDLSIEPKDSGLVSGNSARYAAFREPILKIAAEQGLLPHQVQAIIWTQINNATGVGDVGARMPVGVKDYTLEDGTEVPDIDFIIAMIFHGYSAAEARAMLAERGEKFNPNHDEQGRFAEGPGGIGSALEDAAEQRYGTTDDWHKAGFVLADGRMLDFSEGSDRRTLDHGDVQDLSGNGDDNWLGISNFMLKTGAVRLMPESPGLSFHGKLTEPQIAVLVKVMEDEQDAGRDTFYVDRWGTQGAGTPSEYTGVIDSHTFFQPEALARYLRDPDWKPAPSLTAGFRDLLDIMSGAKFNPNHDEQGRFSESDSAGTLAGPNDDTVEFVVMGRGYVRTPKNWAERVPINIGDKSRQLIAVRNEAEGKLREALAQYPPQAIGGITRIWVMTPEEMAAIPGAKAGVVGLTASHDGQSNIYLSTDIFTPVAIERFAQATGSPHAAERMTFNWVLAHEVAHHWAALRFGDTHMLAKMVTNFAGSRSDATFKEMQDVTDYGKGGGPGEAFAESVGLYVATGKVPGPNTADLFRALKVDVDFKPILEGTHATKDASAAEAYRGVPNDGGGARGVRSREDAAAVAAAVALLAGLKFDESQHPRDEAGKFTAAGGGGGSRVVDHRPDGRVDKAVIAGLHARAVKMLTSMMTGEPAVEHGINYTAAGISLSPLSTGPTFTEWSREDLQDAVVNAHTHPSGGPASLPDVLLLHKFDIPEGIVVGKEFTYTIRPPDGGWDALSRGDLIQLWKGSMADHPIGDSPTGKGNAERLASAARTHEFWMDYAHDTGIKYERTETPQ